MIATNAVWLITGCSKGLGRALAEAALAAGYRVVATARRLADVEALAAAHPDTALAVALDVTDPVQIKAAVAAAEARFGQVEVLVNNAGYGYFAAIEEGEETDVRALFATDLFAPVTLIKAVLPSMRARRAGHIVNVSSIGGYVTFPAVGYYHMVKFALEGLSDTLAQELAPFGIGVTVVAPGAFRTDFRGPSGQQSAIRIPDYAATAGAARDRVLAGHGTQRGDPARGAQAIIKAIAAERPPVHFIIGGDGLDAVRAKVAALLSELEAWEPVTRSTDFAAHNP
jgi:NAD(P)-dependent dehydrogenase (short-subunit alcohol dehydrogenase family)